MMEYESWRISYQSSELAARAAFDEAARLQVALDGLLLAVANKHEGETRYQTALRYICEREAPKDYGAAMEVDVPPNTVLSGQGPR